LPNDEGKKRPAQYDLGQNMLYFSARLWYNFKKKGASKMKRKNERKAKCGLSVIVIIGAALLVCVQPVQAAPITIQIEAIVDTVSDSGNYLGGQVDVCDVITGYYTYESTTTDTSPEDWLGKYEYSQAPYGITLEVGGFHFETNPEDVDFIVYISNERISPIGDIYNIVSNNNSKLHNGVDVDLIYWQLDDRSGQALSSTALPLIAPVLEDWLDLNHLRIQGENENLFIINAHVITAVPEPLTILLLLLGAAALRKRCH
jgi:hypothetical protein